MNANAHRRNAVVAMAMANALHFGAYELARSAIMALFTSDAVAGFSSTAAVTLATGLVSPASFVLWYLHRSVFDAHGPRRALLYTTLAYAFSISSIALLLQWCWSTTPINTTSSTSSESLLPTTWSDERRRLISQVAIVFLFVVKNAFVQLLSAQHWSFITSVLSAPASSSNHAAPPDTSGQWTSIISGVASVVATGAGWLVSPLIHLLARRHNHEHEYEHDDDSTTHTALTGLLLVAAVIMMVTTLISDGAYQIAQRHQFAPLGTAGHVNATDAMDLSSTGSKVRSAHKSVMAPAAAAATTRAKQSSSNPPSLFQRAAMLFERLPVLKALCMETLIYQSMSSFSSYLFVTYTKQSIPFDAERARYTGHVYARINLGSGLLQFAVIPLLLQTTTHYANAANANTNASNRASDTMTRYLWLVMPAIGVASAVGMTLLPQTNTGSNSTSTVVDILTQSFIVTKILEYSLRSSLTERLYGSLDDEGRFFGKETIGMLANRLGKSATAVLLAVLTATRPTFLRHGPVVLACSNTLWLLASFRLVQQLTVAAPKQKGD